MPGKDIKAELRAIEQHSKPECDAISEFSDTESANCTSLTSISVYSDDGDAPELKKETESLDLLQQMEPDGELDSKPAAHGHFNYGPRIRDHHQQRMHNLWRRTVEIDDSSKESVLRRQYDENRHHVVLLPYNARLATQATPDKASGTRPKQVKNNSK